MMMNAAFMYCLLSNAKPNRTNKSLSRNLPRRGEGERRKTEEQLSISTPRTEMNRGDGEVDHKSETPQKEGEGGGGKGLGVFSSLVLLKSREYAAYPSIHPAIHQIEISLPSANPSHHYCPLDAAFVQRQTLLVCLSACLLLCILCSRAPNTKKEEKKLHSARSSDQAREAG